MTFKEKSITRLYAFAMAAVFALVLAGCGGGGGGTAAVEEEPPVMEPTSPTPEQMEAEALSDAQDAAMAAYMAAAAAVAGAVDPVAATKAQMYAGMAKEASDTAAAAGTSAMAGEYQMKAEMYRDSAVEAADMPGLGLIMLANKPLNDDDIENAALAGTEAPKAVNNAENVGKAIMAAGAATTADADITVNAVASAGSLTNQGGLSDSTATQITIGVATDTAVADHGASGSTFAVNIGTTRALVGETASRFHIKGNEAQDLLLPDGTDNTLKTHLVITTDVEGDKVTPRYGTAITLAAGTGVLSGDIPGNAKDFEGTYDVSGTDNIPPQSGRYHCPSAANGVCSISADDKGNIVSVAGYVFEPITSQTDRAADADYLAWGMWVQASIRDSGPTADNRDAQAGAFAYGSDRFNVMAALKGTATYNGAATGLYAAGGMVEYFDADVSLTANFGGTTGGDATPATADENSQTLLGAVTGTVSNIMAGGMAVDGSLALKRAPITSEGDTANGPSDNGFTGTTEGTLGGALLKGAWAGQFYGPNKATGAAIESEYPTGVAGTFNATGGGHTTVSLIGAFGAHRQ